MRLEKRFIAGELRAEQAGGKTYLIGRAASFGVRSHDLGGWREILQPGCFDDALADPSLDCVHTINHSPDRVLGRTSSGTLSLTSDSRGLNYKTELPKVSYASDLVELCRRGDISQSSFAFIVDPDGETWSDIDDPDDPAKRCALRSISKIASLHDVSTVTSPAYPGTAAELASRVPRTMPAELRNRLKLRAADDDDEDTTTGVCMCPCDACVDGDCSGCTNQDCDDEDCRGCPYATRSAGARNGDSWESMAERLFQALEDAPEDEQNGCWEKLCALAEAHGIRTDRDDDEEEAARARRLEVEAAEL
jgi:HK97 family phage prohead protease